jgi:hypothetical protein
MSRLKPSIVTTANLAEGNALEAYEDSYGHARPSGRICSFSALNAATFEHRLKKQELQLLASRTAASAKFSTANGP